MFGTNSVLKIPGHPEVAVKTGTSNNLRDNLAIGYTRDYVTAVWVGNNDNSQMSRIASGVTGATPIFHKIFVTLLENIPPYKWNVPNGLEQKPICAVTGSHPCENCKTIQEWFIKGTGPKGSCPAVQNEENLANIITPTFALQNTKNQKQKRSLRSEMQ
ncbi:MAG: hypothetical protein NZM26_01525 [Patescibacteria group bacterium]|nr:hypothetical protein [Patescibacteria group bacterium]